jgi:SAM-dependent methyltransferase
VSQKGGLVDFSDDEERCVQKRTNDLSAKETHKDAPLEGCTASVERQKILSRLLHPDRTLLDIGCWDGSFSQYSNTASYVGVDINLRALKLAKRKRVEVVLASCDYLPFKSQSFGTCSMIEVIEHFYSPQNAVRESHRILKSNGKLLLATPNFANLADRVSMLIGKHPVEGMEGHQHIRFFTWRSLNRFLERQGFELEKREVWFLPFPARRITKKYRSWRRAMGRLAKLFPNLDEGLLGRWRKISEADS